jgi:hypothetical protein
MAKKLMTVEEAKGMLGTEFIYVTMDGDKMLAYVKAFDPEIGLTCWCDSPTTTDGEDLTVLWDDEEDGFCCIGHNFKYHNIEDALVDLQEIRDTGELRPFDRAKDANPKSALFAPSCSFMR